MAETITIATADDFKHVVAAMAAVVPTLEDWCALREAPPIHVGFFCADGVPTGLSGPVTLRQLLGAMLGSVELYHLSGCDDPLRAFMLVIDTEGTGGCRETTIKEFDFPTDAEKQAKLQQAELGPKALNSFRYVPVDLAKLDMVPAFNMDPFWARFGRDDPASLGTL